MSGPVVPRRVVRRRVGPAEVVFAAVVVVSLVVLYAPRAPSTGGVPGVDKAVHVTLFAALVLTGLRSRADRRLVLLLSVVHAPVSELLQAVLLVHRSGDVLDLVADLVGCAAGWWLAAASRRPDRPGS